MQTILLIIHLFIALALIGFVLMQRSEGGALGIGSSGAGNLFSARGVGNVLTRTTAFLALAFFVTSISLTLLAKHMGGGSLFDRAPASQQNQQNGGSGDNSLLPKLPPPPKAPVSQ